MSWRAGHWHRPWCLVHLRLLSQQKGRTHYETLGVSREASLKDIKESYIQLSKVHHPDSVKGSADDFRVISEAYEVLSNAELKREYDATLPRPTVKGRDGVEYRARRSARGSAPRYRSIVVDLSQKRMENAWHLYKDRWSREEARWKELEQLKKDFRKDVDDIRANMHNMTQEEKELFLEGMRQFRRPEHYQQFRQNHANSDDPTKTHSSDTDNKEPSYSEFRDEMIKKAKELKEKADKVKAFYDKSEFLGENYSDKKIKSVKYDINQEGEEFRISQRTVQIIFALFIIFFIVDINYKNDIRKTNRFLLMEEENRKKDSS